MRLILGNQLDGQVIAMLSRTIEEEARVHMDNIVLINNLNNAGEVKEQLKKKENSFKMHLQIIRLQQKSAH